MEADSTILLVDDNPANLRIAERTLSRAGYVVLKAASGEDCLETVAAQKPDLILLDVMMPGMDGYECCKRLKDQSDLKSIPVIFLTAKISSEDKVVGIEVGGVDYITKPFNSRDLLERVGIQLLIARRNHKKAGGSE